MLNQLREFERARRKKFDRFIEERGLKTINVFLEVEILEDIDRFFEELLPFLGDEFLGHAVELFEEGETDVKSL